MNNTIYPIIKFLLLWPILLSLIALINIMWFFSHKKGNCDDCRDVWKWLGEEGKYVCQYCGTVYVSGCLERRDDFR